MKKAKNILLLALILMLTISASPILQMHQVLAAEPNEPHNANAMWIEPSQVNVTGQSIGYKFNITVWINVTVTCGGWQFKLFYNKNYLNATGCGYTGGSKSNFFQNVSNTMPVTPSFESYNATHNFVQHGESWLGGSPAGPGYGSLSWVEFEVMAEPPEGGQILAILDISSAYHPPNSDTYALDFDGVEIALTISNCLYIFKSSVIITYTLTITATTGGTTNPAPGTHTYSANTNVQVTANANPNYLFDHWELDSVNVGSTNPYLVLMDSNHTLHAVFAPIVIEGTKISVEPPEIIDPTLLPGSIFSINITIDDVADLKVLEFNLSYNPAIINWVSMAIIKVQNVTPTIKTVIDDEIGFIWTRLNYSTPVFTDTPAPVLRIDFQVKSLGSTPLDLHDTVFLDSLGQPIEHVTIDGFFSTLIQDIAITSVTTSRSWAYAGWNVNVTVTVKNNGSMSETFGLRAHYDGNLIGAKVVTSLAPDEERTVIFEWDTTGVAEGNYTINAEADILPYESNTGDNALTDGIVWIMTQIHDIAILNITVPNYAYQGWKVNITVTVKNKGNLTEIFTVEAFVDSDSLGTVTVTDLAPATEFNITYLWDTKNVTACRNYTISAEASIHPYEYNATDNSLIDGKIKVRIMGDVNGDGKVDVQDIFAVAKAFGSYPPLPRFDPAFDLLQDLKIDIKDIFIIAKNFGKSCT
jgi:hypothetical protein